MTAPIGMAAVASADSAQVPAVPQADGDDGGFTATFGAAMAAQQTGQLAPIIPDPVPTQPLLQLLTDGEWRPDDVSLANAEESNPEPGSGAKANPVHEAGIVPLEKSLANWFAAVGRRGGSAERAVVPVSGDPAEVNTEEDPANPSSGDAVGPAKSGGPESAVLIVVPPNIPASGSRTDGTSPSVTADEETPGPDAAAADRTGGRVWRGTADGQRTIEPPRRAPYGEDAPMTREPVIEIAGFTFHDPAEERGQGNHAPGGASPSAEPTPELAARIREHRITGGNRDLAQEALRRITAPESRPGEESATTTGRIRLAQEAPKAAAQRTAFGGERDNARSRHETEPAPATEVPVQWGERHGADGTPRTVPVASAAARPLVDTATTPGPEPMAATATDPGERIARRVDHLMLDLKDDQGDYGKLRVSVSGSNVRATIMPNDQAMADRLNIDLRQLHQSLTERGFPEPKITVQNPVSTELPRWNPLAREGVADTAPTDHRSPGRHGPDDEQQERWNGTKEQQRERREQGRTPDQPRQQKRDSNGRDA